MGRPKNVILLIGLLCLVVFLFDTTGILRVNNSSVITNTDIEKEISAVDQSQPVSRQVADSEFFSATRFALLGIGVLLLIRIRVRRISG